MKKDRAGLDAEIKRGVSDYILCPSPKVRVSMMKEYIKAAEEYYKEMWGNE